MLTESDLVEIEKKLSGSIYRRLFAEMKRLQQECCRLTGELEAATKRNPHWLTFESIFDRSGAGSTTEIAHANRRARLAERIFMAMVIDNHVTNPDVIDNAFSLADEFLAKLQTGTYIAKETIC